MARKATTSASPTAGPADRPRGSWSRCLALLPPPRAFAKFPSAPPPRALTRISIEPAKVALTLPPETAATISLPFASSVAILENGNLVHVVASEGGLRSIVHLDRAGDYTFTIRKGTGQMNDGAKTA